MKLAICQVLYKPNEFETEACIRAVVGELGAVRLPEVTGQSSLAEARTEMLRLAMLAGSSDAPEGLRDVGPFEAFLWVDHDMAFTVSDVKRLVDELKGADVVGAEYWDRHAEAPAWRPLGSGSFVLGKGGEPVPARCGFGLVVHTRRAVELAGQGAPVSEAGGEHWFAQHVDGDGEWLREDYSFCERVRKAGGKAVVHTGVNVGHLQMQPVYWYTRFMRERVKPPESMTLNLNVVKVTERAAEPVGRVL